MHITPLEYLVIASTILEFNPLLQTIKAIKRKSVEDLSIWTFLSITTLGTLWLIYGFTIKNLPLIIGNSIKLFTALSVVVIYFVYKKKS